MRLSISQDNHGCRAYCPAEDQHADTPSGEIASRAQEGSATPFTMMHLTSFPARAVHGLTDTAVLAGDPVVSSRSLLLHRKRIMVVVCEHFSVDHALFHMARRNLQMLHFRASSSYLSRIIPLR